MRASSPSRRTRCVSVAALRERPWRVSCATRMRSTVQTITPGPYTLRPRCLGLSRLCRSLLAQRKGYGRMLIDFSYELSKVEGKIGTPERPLSDLGAVSYRSFWTRVILELLREYRGNISIKDISARAAIRPEDIVQTLQSLQLMKWWKGQHIISANPKARQNCRVVHAMPSYARTDRWMARRCSAARPCSADKPVVVSFIFFR